MLFAFVITHVVVPYHISHLVDFIVAKNRLLTSSLPGAELARFSSASVAATNVKGNIIASGLVLNLWLKRGGVMVELGHRHAGAGRCQASNVWSRR